MRDYAKAVPKMWHGKTFKALRKHPEGLVVALYLMISPSSNMLGLYAQPVLYMAYETGLGEEGARKGLQQCIEAGYCAYDDESEFVWVHEMASYQIASELKASDLRCKGIQKDYDALPDNPFLGEFFDRYAEAFHLHGRRGEEGVKKGLCNPLARPYEAKNKNKNKNRNRKRKSLTALSAAPTTGPAKTHLASLDCRTARFRTWLTCTTKSCPNCRRCACSTMAAARPWASSGSSS